MSNEHELKSLIPIDLNKILDPNKKPDLSQLTHLDRLSALVFVFMQARYRADEQFKKWFANAREQGVSLDEILKTDEFKQLWPLSETQTLNSLPEIVTRKILDVENPFGFSPEATRAALEMAHELSSTQMHIDGMRLNVIGSHELDPTSYFQETMLQMYHFGSTVDPSTLFPSQFPAGRYWGELFPQK